MNNVLSRALLRFYYSQVQLGTVHCIDFMEFRYYGEVCVYYYFIIRITIRVVIITAS